MPNLANNSLAKNKKEQTQLAQVKVVSARLQAIWWLSAVIKDGRSVNDLLSVSNLTLDKQASGSHSKNDSPLARQSQNNSQLAFAKHILFGSLRYFHQIKAILEQLLDKPLKQKDTDIFCILISGIYQLKYLSVPDHAAISESVDLAKSVNKKWASGLINAVLRGYQRKNKEIGERLSKADTFLYSHPNWIINQLKMDWPNNYKKILTANNERAPMAIRINTNLTNKLSYQKLLEEQGINSQQHSIAKDALILDQPCDVYSLPGFTQGQSTVQDVAPQLVVELLDLKPGFKVLDGCAAPGGKTTHILQREPNTLLTSVEKSASRLERVTEVLSRFNMLDNSYKVKLLNVDFLDYQDWWNGEFFDRILIDVPCSASGVIRRNPDIKIHRKKTDMESLVKIQREILNSAWQMLKPGGKLVYATCSVFKVENEDQINQFFENNRAKLLDMPLEAHQELKDKSVTDFGYQIFPGQMQMDGFYFCGLEKLLSSSDQS
ncbi:MAG: 16S rRNA (cytosine(967)-C(5))-methyltransferase [Kangiella sp.]|nr:MAG: 16S rRNA (cytosine(967)-C(5))-methyltransferase [Kangiella sp.]